MPVAEEGRGTLLFSTKPPHITGMLRVNGVDYEVSGYHATAMRAEIKLTPLPKEMTDEPR